jgi:hypothetical protein
MSVVSKPRGQLVIRVGDRAAYRINDYAGLPAFIKVQTDCDTRVSEFLGKRSTVSPVSGLSLPLNVLFSSVNHI